MIRRKELEEPGHTVFGSASFLRKTYGKDNQKSWHYGRHV